MSHGRQQSNDSNLTIQSRMDGSRGQKAAVNTAKYKKCQSLRSQQKPALYYFGSGEGKRCRSLNIGSLFNLFKIL